MRTERHRGGIGLVLLMVFSAAAAEASVYVMPSPQSGKGAVALVVDGQSVAVFRGPLGAMGPAERAKAAANRIELLIDSQENAPASARAVPEGFLILAGSRPLFTLTPADVDLAAGQTLADEVANATARLQRGIVGEREQHTPAFVLRAVAAAVAAALVFLGLLWLLRLTRRFLLRRIGGLVRAQMPSIRVGSFTVLESSRIARLLLQVAEWGVWAVRLVAAYIFVTFVLTRFPYTRPWGQALGQYLLNALQSVGLSVLGALPSLFIVVVIVLLTRLLARLVNAFFAAVESGKVETRWIDAETAQPTRRIAIAAVWIFAVIVAYPYLPGSGSDAFKGVSVFVGLIISIGSAGVMNQVMSGLVLMYARALKPGEYVRIREVEGTVLELGILSTKIRTTKGELVVIPNTVAVSSETKNFTRLAGEGSLILYTSVTIGYDAPWRQVHAMLILAAGRTLGLRHDPPPFVLQRALSDFYVEYELNAYLDRASQRIPTLAALHSNIQDVFNEYGVQIMSPHFLGQPQKSVTVPKSEWFTPPAAPEKNEGA